MFFDAHVHLQAPELAPYWPEVVRDLEAMGLTCAVVNGTEEADWPAVAALADRYEWVLPSYGLHPWLAARRSPRWLENLVVRLDEEATLGRRHAIGEIGLDRWRRPFDAADQQDVFLSQLALGAARNLPVSIHGLKAWGPLDELLHRTPVPARGFLLHAYTGPASMVPRLARRGAYFSFNGRFLDPRFQRAMDTFRHVPHDRLLIETDAPSMRPPASHVSHPLPTAADGHAPNHPANLAAVYPALATLLNLSETTLRTLIKANFERFFGPPPGPRQRKIAERDDLPRQPVEPAA